jgi:MFS family permease
MPHVQSRALVDVAATDTSIRAAILTLDPWPTKDAGGGAAPTFGGDEYDTVRTDGPAGELTVTYLIEPATGPKAIEGDTRVSVTVRSDVTVAYFRWFVVPLTWFMVRAEARSRTAAVAAIVNGDEPAPPKRSVFLPPTHFSVAQAQFLAVAAFAAAVANFGGALLGQEGTYAQHGFGVSRLALGNMLTVTRFGILVSLAAAVLSDRIGRRRLILWSLGGLAVSNAIGATAPNFFVFSVSQFFARGFVNAVMPVAAIAIIEEAPEGARAFAMAMLAIAMGAGYAVSVILLPLSDSGQHAFRISFAVSAATILFLPRLSRRLKETHRFALLRDQHARRGRMRDVLDRKYARRFFLIAFSSFLGNMFSAPASQLTNSFLRDERHFSAAGIALWRTVTAGVPGIAGVIIGGRLADVRGRRPVAICALLVAGVFEIVFFLGAGWVLWTSTSVAVVAAGIAGPAVGTFSTELFPTEIRGSANGMIVVAGVLGSIVGLVGVTHLADYVGGLGPALAIAAVVPIIVALFVIPFFPEGANRDLDELSPSIYGLPGSEGIL